MRRIVTLLALSGCMVTFEIQAQNPNNVQPIPAKQPNAGNSDPIVPASFLFTPEEDSKNDSKNAGENSTSGQPAFAGGIGNSITRVTKTMSQLPNEAGQIWREYDISPYTSRITTTQNPQQAIIDWILKETGTNMWFNEPLGLLSANKTTLKVYHTAEIHGVVSRIVDRLVHSQGQPQILGLKMVTVANPNWRSKAFTMLQTIRVQTPGVQGWMVSKENAAVLFNQLKARSDFQMVNAGDISIHDGQKLKINQRRPVEYYQDLQPVAAAYQTALTQYQGIRNRIEEGYSLEIGAMTSLDKKTIETVLRCDIDQVEKLQPIRVDIPVAGGRNQSVELQIPQLISWRLNERFRWPADQVLLLSCGVIATPAPDGGGGIDLAKIINRSRGRADALLFIEYKGPAQASTIPQLGAANANRPAFVPQTIRQSNLPAGDLVPVIPRR